MELRSPCIRLAFYKSPRTLWKTRVLNPLSFDSLSSHIQYLFSRPFGLHFALKKRGWGRGRPPWAPPLGPSPGSATGTSLRSWRDSGRQVRYVVSWINGSPFALPRKKPRAQQSRQLGRLTATRPIKGGKLVAKLMHSTGFDLWTYHFSHMGKNIVLSLIG